MRWISKLIGVALLLLGLYFLGKNIFFTTNVFPYFWRGLAADFSILSLTVGVVMVFTLPREQRSLGWIFVFLGILSVFASSRVLLRPTSLWQFFLAAAAMTVGFQLFDRGRLRF
ncbi:hypothetical protein [Trichothermofontia sp.]